MNFSRNTSAMRQHAGNAAALLLILFSASCAGPITKPISTATSVSEATPVPQASNEIRFALIGNVTAANAWSLFDAKGYSYNNYAVRSEYWPRLYRLSTPNRQFEAAAASGPPSSIQAEGNFFTATIPLRTDLTWTDGSPFTAEDVAFTVKTVLSFQLGFDWRNHYDTEWIDHVEAPDTQTVKFYLKKMPSVDVWQYSILQGPILQKAYWTPKIEGAAGLLPSADNRSQIESLKTTVANLQKRVDGLYAESVTLTGEASRQMQASIQKQQGDLDKASNDLTKAQTVFDAAMEAARSMLYPLKDEDEPRLGTWNYKASGNGWIENEANPKYPFGHPGFNIASYHFYPNETAAIKAYSNGEVDAILLPGGLSSMSLSGNPSLQTVMKSSNHNLRFLIFNPLFTAFNDPAIHQALACVIVQEQLASRSNGQADALESFVLPSETPWENTDAALPCKGLDDASRIEQAVQILKTAGYTWNQEPAANTPGLGLKMPNGGSFPSATLLVSSEDDVRVVAAAYVQHQARMLGIPVTARSASSIELNYAVFSSNSYEMALLGWHVSSYPGYLCDWFGEGNPFDYAGSQIISLCSSLNGTSDLDAAHQQISEIQSILVQELPFIPLYSGVTYDAYRNMTYPFDQIPDGLSGLYGLPELASPVQK